MEYLISSAGDTLKAMTSNGAARLARRLVDNADSREMHSLTIAIDPETISPGSSKPWEKGLSVYHDEDAALTVERMVAGRLGAAPFRPMRLRLQFQGFRD